MTVRQLIRELNNFDPKDRVCISKNGKALFIGKDFSVTIPSEIDRDIETIHLEQNGIID